jgi:hypothetical protein
MKAQMSDPKSANTFDDLTGISTSSFSNPYDALIASCEDNPVRRYQQLDQQAC